MAKYDFMVRSWWCLNEVRMRFVLCDWCWPEPEPGDATDESYDKDSIDDDNSDGWSRSDEGAKEEWLFSELTPVI